MPAAHWRSSWAIVIGRTGLAALRSASLSLKRPEISIEELVAVGQWFAHCEKSPPNTPTISDAGNRLFWSAECSCFRCRFCAYRSLILGTLQQTWTSRVRAPSCFLALHGVGSETNWAATRRGLEDAASQKGPLLARFPDRSSDPFLLVQAGILSQFRVNGYITSSRLRPSGGAVGI